MQECRIGGTDVSSPMRLASCFVNWYTQKRAAIALSLVVSTSTGHQNPAANGPEEQRQAHGVLEPAALFPVGSDGYLNRAMQDAILILAFQERPKKRQLQMA